MPSSGLSAFVDPFVVSTVEVFRSLLACDLAPPLLSEREAPTARHEMAVILGLRGPSAGGVMVLEMPRQTAQRLVLHLLGGEVDESSLVDALGEIANIIAGNALAALAREGLTLALSTPSVVTGRAFAIHLPDQPTVCAFWESGFGPFGLSVALRGV